MDFVFTNTPPPSTSYFYEGPAPRDRLGPSNADIYVNTGSIDTTAIDAWTQGVEISTQRRYDAGTAKIWSGEPGHAMLKSWFGMDRNVRLQQPYGDIDLFNPVAYILAQVSGTISSWTFPIITGDSDQHENYSFDGIIEPLTIRPRVAFFSIDIPFESHDIKGALEDGNVDIHRGSDRVVNVYEFDKRRMRSVPFLDMVDSFANIARPGYFITDKIELPPFADVGSNSMPNPLAPNMRPSDDSYVPAGSIAMPAGFVYDGGNPIATDSVAFGGMTY